MQAIELILEKQRDAMLAEYPDHQALTNTVFEEISAMLCEDFGEITRISKRWKLVFACIADVLTKAHLQNVRKKYATDVLDVLLNPKITSYMENVLEDKTGRYACVINGARAELTHSQWSDPTSKHWERSIRRFQM